MDLLTLQETMQRLSKSDSTIRRMMKRGEIPYQKIHGRYYFHVLDVNKHLPSPSSNDEVIRDLSNRIGRLELEVDELKQQLEHMTRLDRIDEKQPVVSQQVNTPTHQIKASQPNSTAILERLPEGTLHIQQWLAQYGLKSQRRKIVNYLEAPSNGLSYHKFPKPNRPSEDDRYLTPDQQDMLITWLTEKHPEVFEQ